VGGRAAGDAAGQASRHYYVCIDATYAKFWSSYTKGIYPARPLEAVTTAKASLTKTTLGQLGFISIPDGVNTFFFRFFE
jgi:hypothetical protein